MQFFAVLAIAAAGLVAAQVPANPCTEPNSNYCSGESGSTNIIARCHDGQPTYGNCNDNLSGLCRNSFARAVCQQSSDTAGDAECKLVSCE